MLHLGSSLVFQALVREEFSIHFLPVIWIFLEPVVRLSHDSRTGAAYGHDRQPELFGFGEGSSVNRIRDVLGQDAGSGASHTLQLVKFDSQFVSDLDRRRVKLWTAPAGDAAGIECVFHFSSCSAFSKIFLILSASGLFECMYGMGAFPRASAFTAVGRSFMRPFTFVSPSDSTASLPSSSQPLSLTDAAKLA